MAKQEDGSGAAAHVAGYLRDAQASIDAVFGQGYAAAHPELVVAFVNACSADQLACVLRDHIGGGLGEVGAGLQSVGSGLMTANFGG